VNTLNRPSVLIVSDDAEFTRTIAARWQAERHVPEITLVSSGVWQSAGAANYDLVIVGPVRDADSPAILASVSAAQGAAAVCFAEQEKDVERLHADYPHLLVVPRQDGWVGTLILVATEALRRVEAARRAQRAEGLTLSSQRHATLGLYMLEMRPSINNALTSVLGNADLLLLEPEHASFERREQIQTIHSMALRLNEIMQRFSSLATEMQADEKESQAETQRLSQRQLSRS
jgi:signal transduction histidine kinase